jgi:hypothetical protein
MRGDRAALDPAIRQRIADVRGVPVEAVFPDEIARRLENPADPAAQLQAARVVIGTPELAERAGLTPPQRIQAAQLVLERVPPHEDVARQAAHILMRGDPAALDPEIRQRIADIRGMPVEVVFGGTGK